MKIAVLTLRLHSNYGGILQAYALMTVLKWLGHEPFLIYNRYYKNRNFLSRNWLYLKNGLKKVVLRQKEMEVFSERRYRNEYEVICRNTAAFIEKHLQPRTVPVCSTHEWNQLPKQYDFDAYIVGSDQVWRTTYAKDIEHYFLSFVHDPKVKRLSYAASFGTDEWLFTPKQTTRCGRLLKKFDGVSVREESGVTLCQNHWEVTAEHVLDPTMLLTKSDYLELLPSLANPAENNRLLVYLLDMTGEKEKIVTSIETQKHLKRFFVNNPYTNNSGKEMEKRIAPPVEQWLGGFATSKFVVTDSFHACVFSLLFHIPFCAIGNKKRGMARFNSLLSLFGLEERLIDPASNFQASIDSFPEIDWSAVDKKLELLRQKSIDFLVQHLR